MSGTFSALACVDHLARLDPAVGEMLVDEDRHRTARRPEDLEHLAKEPPARIELLELLVVGIVAVLGDQEDRVDGELARAERERIGDRRAQRGSRAASPWPGPGRSFGRRLLDEQAGDLERRLVQAAAVVDREAIDESSDDVIGMRQVVVDRRECGDLGAAGSNCLRCGGGDDGAGGRHDHVGQASRAQGRSGGPQKTSTGGAWSHR